MSGKIKPRQYVNYQFVNTAPPQGTGYTVLNQNPRPRPDGVIDRASTDTLFDDPTGLTAAAKVLPNVQTTKRSI